MNPEPAEEVSDAELRALGLGDAEIAEYRAAVQERGPAQVAKRGDERFVPRQTPEYIPPLTPSGPLGLAGLAGEGERPTGPTAEPNEGGPEGLARDFDRGGTAAEAKMDALRMDDGKIAEIAEQMIEAGLLAEDYDRQMFNTAWSRLVDLAADWHEANPGTYLSPQDMIEIYGGQRGGAAPLSTDTTSSVTLSDSTQAWGLLRQMIRSELGRNPTDAEVDDFQAALNDAQTKAPVVTTTKTRTDAAGNRVTNATKTGGMDDQGYTEKYVHDEMDDEYKSYQAATTYFNAFTDAIGRTV